MMKSSMMTMMNRFRVIFELSNAEIVCVSDDGLCNLLIVRVSDGSITSMVDTSLC